MEERWNSQLTLIPGDPRLQGSVWMFASATSLLSGFVSINQEAVNEIRGARINEDSAHSPPPVGNVEAGGAAEVIL